MIEHYIGLMSGTSLDGVDGVLAACSAQQCRVLAHVHRAFEPRFAHRLLALNQPGNNELHEAALCANALNRVYADVVSELLRSPAAVAATVRAIGAHGQTVRHRPGEFDGTGYTWQINNPALLAELTGIDVVADFRNRDLAAGGQGAPLVPAFHQAVFSRAGQMQAVLNIGGIANLSVLDGERVLGFDCGPGNVLMDAWCQEHTGQPFDHEGRWAASGRVHPALLEQLLEEAYFALPLPKSTGRDLFRFEWLTQHLRSFDTLRPPDVQATLAELTATVCAADVLRHARLSKELVVCGGGALNRHLMQRLQALSPQLVVKSSAEFGLPPLQVEAAAFAWLARKTVQRETASLPSVTGACAARILGAIYPA